MEFEEREGERFVSFPRSKIAVCMCAYYKHFEYLWIQIMIRES